MANIFVLIKGFKSEPLVENEFVTIIGNWIVTDRLDGMMLHIFTNIRNEYNKK